MLISLLKSIQYQNKESLCDSLRAHMSAQVHLHLHMGRIPAERFHFIGNAISYKVKNRTSPMSKHQKSPIIRFTYSYYYYILSLNHYINRLHPEVHRNQILRFLPLLHPQHHIRKSYHHLYDLYREPFLQH